MIDPAMITATRDAHNVAMVTARNAVFCLASSWKSGDLLMTVRYCPMMIHPSRISRAKMVAVYNECIY